MLDTLYIALTVLRPGQKRALGVDVERTRSEIVETLVYRVMGPPENEAVLLKPSMVFEPKGHRAGVWGADEPHPDTYLPPVSEIGPVLPGAAAAVPIATM